MLNKKNLDQEVVKFSQLMQGSSNKGANGDAGVSGNEGTIGSNCKFKEDDKILAISVDDLDTPKKEMKALTDYAASKNLPVILFSNENAKPDTVKDMQNRLNEKSGWHGTDANKLDENPPDYVDKSVIAWSYGRDGEGRKAKMKGNSNIIARGVLCDREKAIGKFDQHDVPSCSIGHHPNPETQKENVKQLRIERKKVLDNGGVFSVHLHNANGLDLLKETVTAFEKSGGKFVHLNQLKGCGDFSK